MLTCLFIYLSYFCLKRTAHLAINANLPCVPLKHIYIYTQVKHMVKIEYVKYRRAYKTFGSIWLC